LFQNYSNMFQTKVDIPYSSLNISYSNKIMTLGSCFAENIGLKMKNVFFDTEINPFGVLYNPVSICNSIKILLENNNFTKDNLFENRGLWQSFSHSSLFTASSAEQCIDNINTRLSGATTFLKNTDFLLITFGTAWVYEDKESGSVVSNCHKLPARMFNRRRLSVEEIVAVYSPLISLLKSRFPDLKLIFSVSPIRHWKDGAHENNISKSILLLAIDALQKQFETINYFPAYEIQLDELRDYRFYASDMLHPSEVAIDYIWERFTETYFSEETKCMKKEFEQLKSDLSHRPMFPDSVEYLKFQLYIQNKKDELILKYPFLQKRL
jgi:hypothetical protein